MTGLHVAGIFEHLIQRALPGSGAQEEMNRFVESLARFLRRTAAAGYIERHGVSNELIALSPDLGGVFDRELHVGTVNNDLGLRQPVVFRLRSA